MNQVRMIQKSVNENEPNLKNNSSKTHQRAKIILFSFLIDLLLILFGISIIEYIYPYFTGSKSSFYFVPSIVILFLITSIAVHAYSIETIISFRVSARKSAKSALIAGGLLLFLLFALQQSDTISRLEFTLTIMAMVLILPFGRYLAARNALALLKGEVYSIVQIEEHHNNLISIHTSNSSPSFQLHWDIRKDDPNAYDSLAQAVGHADRVIVQCEEEHRSDWAHILTGLNVHGEILAKEFSTSRLIGIGRYKDDTTLVVARGPLGLADRLTKRAFDVLLSSLILFALAPLFLLTAIAIKLDSRGPIFFRQVRIGRQNRMFNIYKFRSMRQESADAAGTRSATRDDDRITTVGRIMRKTSIDELPQLINVLIGDMSIVGPRPHALYSTANDKLFWEVNGKYWHRHACRPGITGLAQVRGHRGATHLEKDLEDRLASDLEYLNRWSILLDVWILIRTLGVITHKNAF